jgi:hypothetical protein
LREERELWIVDIVDTLTLQIDMMGGLSTSYSLVIACAWMNSMGHTGTHSSTLSNTA